MHPELFEIPFIHVTVKTYGTLMVIGFLVAVWVMRRMMKRHEQNPDDVTNIAMYALICGIVGARLFHVIHHHDQYNDNFMGIFAVWKGGLELLGGVLASIAFLWAYLYCRKLPKRIYLDVLAVGLMIGLGFGRIGCLMFGCCYGKCTNAPWAIQFPYGSPAYYSQTHPDPARGREEPLLDLPSEYYTIEGYLKEYDDLTEEQKHAVDHGPYQTLKVHPTQLYSSIDAFLIAGVLYLLWRKFGQTKPGIAAGCMLILYGPNRFFMESLRDDNPFETAWWAVYKGGTVSQNLAIYMFTAGVILLIIFATRKPELPPGVSAKE